MIRVHRNRSYKVVNNNKQPQAKKTFKWCDVSAYNLLVMGPLIMKLGALNDDKTSEARPLMLLFYGLMPNFLLHTMHVSAVKKVKETSK